MSQEYVGAGIGEESHKGRTRGKSEAATRGAKRLDGERRGRERKRKEKERKRKEERKREKERGGRERGRECQRREKGKVSGKRKNDRH